jgi:hypothetical protein
MKQINELSMMINQHFNWNKARMNCFIGMLVALLSTRSINLTELAMAFPSPAKLDSRYRRIQRFITEYSPNFDKVAWFIMGLFNFIDSDYYLTMDRTNWRWGKKDINILVLAVAYKGAAIPIYWMLLNKKGNSSTLERKVLVNRFIKQFGKKHILGLLADREFIGKKWFEWLKVQEIDFVIRIKKDAKTTNSQGQKLQVQHLFRFLKVGEKQSIQDLRTITDVGVYLTALRLDNGELLIVASSKKTEQAIESYKERWQIETLFSCLKGRGFNLEDTHVTQRLRIKRLLIVPVIAFCWAHRTGEWQHEKVKKIKVKKHERLAKSIFRVGLDLIRDSLFKAIHSLDCDLKPLFQFLDFNKLYAKC